MNRKKARQVLVMTREPTWITWSSDPDSNGDGHYVASLRLSADAEPDRLLILELTAYQARRLAGQLIDRAAEIDERNASANQCRE